MIKDKEKVLDMEWFHIASNLFIFRPWQLFVEAEIEEMKIIPIWVIVRRLPMELQDEDGFSVGDSAIGMSLFVDKFTKEAQRSTYVRICVEIGADYEYLDAIIVMLDKQKVYLQLVEYNLKPPH